MPCTSKNPDGRFRHGYGSPQFRLFLEPRVFSSLHVLVGPIGGGASLKKRNKLAPPLDVFWQWRPASSRFYSRAKKCHPAGSSSEPLRLLFSDLPTKGNKIEAAVVIANRDDRGWLGRGGTGREKTVRRMRPAASRCRF